jgi:TolA-binding protein
MQITLPQILVTIVISLIAAGATYLAARVSANASKTNTVTSSRVEMEKEAYERARALDVGTIKQQEEKLEKLAKQADEQADAIREVRRDNDRLYGENRIVLEDNVRLRGALAAMQERLVRVERGLHPDSTEKINQRITDTAPMGIGSQTDPRMREIIERERRVEER